MTPPASTIDSAATSGFHNAQSYDAHRPSYPAESVQALLHHLGVAGQAGAKVVDLAAGTGKFTELLAAREEGFETAAVEPLASMRDALVGKGLGGVDVTDGTAEEMGVGEGWADAVVAAQAFHWFANEKALKEIHRTLKPGGKLGMIWNVEDYNQPRNWQTTTTWEDQLNAMILNLEAAGPPRFRDEGWAQVFDRQSSSSPLFSTPIGQDKVAWTVWRDAGALWDRVSTLSQVATLEGGARREFKARLDEILAGDDVERDGEGRIAFHGVTFLAWTTRL